VAFVYFLYPSVVSIGDVQIPAQESGKMYRQNNRLRVDTDGANESHVSPSRGPPLQVESFDPFAFIAAAGNASGNTGR
jgi:hypothetical protein